MPFVKSYRRKSTGKHVSSYYRGLSKRDMKKVPNRTFASLRSEINGISGSIGLMDTRIATLESRIKFTEGKLLGSELTTNIKKRKKALISISRWERQIKKIKKVQKVMRKDRSVLQTWQSVKR